MTSYDDSCAKTGKEICRLGLVGYTCAWGIYRELKVEIVELDLFGQLENIYRRPRVFEFYTAEELWTDAHTSKQMLKYHLNESVDLSSRNFGFIEQSVTWIVSHFHVNEETVIADFGCGPGLYTLRLAQRGADVTGIDFSARSLEYARQEAARKSLDIMYIRQNYLELELEKRFDLILMIMCDFCALSPAQRKRLLEKFYMHLKPGGGVLLDVYTLNGFDQREETATCQVNQLDGFWSAQKYYGFVNTFKYDEEKVTLDKYTLVEKDRTRTVYNWLQYFTRESLTEELRDGRFEVQEFFADVAGTPFDAASSEMAVVARKV